MVRAKQDVQSTAIRKQSDKMVESRARLGEQRRQQSRQAIIDAAMTVFQDKTPDATVVGDLIEAADVARGTFYNHFKDVDDVCSAVALRLSDDFNKAIIAVDSVMPDAAERVSIAVRHFVRRAAIEPKWGWVIVRVAFHGALDKLFRDALRPDLESGIAAGRFHSLDLSVGADVVIGTAIAAMRTVLEGKPSNDHAELVAAAILRALGLEERDAFQVAQRPLPKLS